jgi:omega-6 fatty acid desaturase (delta-12 desaturase)
MTKESYLNLRSGLEFRPNNGRLFSHFFIDMALISGPIYWLRSFHSSGVHWSLGNAGAGISCIVLLAVFYFRSFSMMHEAVHGSGIGHRKWNDRLGLFYGIFCFLPFEHWKEIHLLHHHWAGNVEKDPVMKLVLDFRKPPTRAHRIFSLLWRSWFPILALMQNYVFWFVCISRFRQHKSASRWVSLILPVAIWGLFFAFAGMQLSCLILIPSILAYMCLVEVINFPHHLSLPQYEGDTKLNLWDQHQIARSCIYPKLFSSVVLLNFNYHTEHHLFPTLPWYRLPIVSQALRSSLPEYNLSIGNAWIRANRRKSLEEVLKGIPTTSPDSATTKAA